MLVVQSFHPGDADQALRFAQWTEELGGAKGHELLLMPDTTCDPTVVEEIRQTFARSFDTVEVLLFVDHFKKWPAAPNAILGTAARHIMRTRPQPWLLCEPDCVFMRPGAFDAIWAEYQTALAAGKFFLADFVSVHTPELDVDDHASGNAVYPADMFEHAGNALIAGPDLAWDMAARDQILPKLHTSELILHSWRHGSFENWDQVEREILAFKPNVALFHSDKSGSLIPLLRARRAPSISVHTEPGQVDEPSGALRERDVAGFTCDILIKSYPPDYELLRYCLRSIETFATGFRRAIVIIPNDAPTPDLPALVPDFTWAIIRVEETGEGYLFQQAVKINAHEYTDADYILHIDSDTMLTKPVTPLTFFREVFKSGLGDVTKSILGKPVTEKKPLWLMTPYENTETPWQPFTEKFLGEPVQFEFMRRFPMLIPRSLHVSADVFCRVRHKMSLAQYILSQPHREFSEFNALGAWAHSRRWEEFSWLDTTKEELPELVAIQRWSHEPLTDAIREQLEGILTDKLEVYTTPVGEKLKEKESAAIRQTAAGHWIINGDTHISAWVEEKGQLQHDFQTLPLILAEINEGDVVVDVGANIGDTTWPFIEKVGDKGHVYAFEPNPDAFACLLRNVGGELSGNVTIENVALGDVPAGGYINAEANAGAASISDHGKGIYIVPLDSRDFDRCDFIKIDVEGYELNVLRGAEQTIAKFRPKMAIEINEGALRRQGTSQIEVFAWLDAHAYQWWPLVAPNLEQDLPQYDILCRPMEIYDTPVGKKVRYKNEPRAHSENLQTTLVPWESKPDSIAEIRRLCARLKEFETCPAYTALVRKELKARKVIR